MQFRKPHFFPAYGGWAVRFANGAQWFAGENIRDAIHWFRKYTPREAGRPIEGEPAISEEPPVERRQLAGG